MYLLLEEIKVVKDFFENVDCEIDCDIDYDEETLLNMKLHLVQQSNKKISRKYAHEITQIILVAKKMLNLRTGNTLLDDILSKQEILIEDYEEETLFDDYEQYDYD